MEPELPEVWINETPSSPITFSRCVLYTSVTLLAALLTWYQWKRSKIDKMIASIPGPPVWPITGNAHIFFGLDMEGICDKLVELIKEYGPTCRFWMGPFLWVNLAEPNDLEKILTSEFTTNKDPTYRFFKDHGAGMFTASGEEWKKMRKVVNPTFNQKLLEQFVETFYQQGKILVNVLEDKADKPTFDISSYLGRCTLDMFCGTQMNVETNEQTNDTCDFSGRLKKSLAVVKLRFYKIHLQSDTIYSMTEMGKENKKNVRFLHDFVGKVIAERRRVRQVDNETNGDTIDVAEEKMKKAVYLDAILDHYGHLSDYDLAYLTTDVVIAGSDTTSVAMGFTFMLLGTYTDIQEKVYQEVISAVGDGDEPITHLDLPKFTYLEMVLKEILRHYSVPAIVRKLDKDTSLGHVTLPAGTSVQLCLYGVHRDTRYWSHPDDFYPDHFLPENVAKRPKFSFIPFSMGPRNCPGYAFAMMSMKTVVATVIRRYKFKSNVDIKTMQYNNYFMLEPKTGYLLQLSKR